MNMLSIEWHGSRSHSQDDTDRARRAAEAVLDAAGINDYAALFREVCARIDDGRDPPPVWIVAEAAANHAATEGWAERSYALVSISA
jgi:hypothetical protein